MSDFWNIRAREGLPYGSIPWDNIVHKLEETDPELVKEVKGQDFFDDIEDQYDNYARSEITDWAPDAPYLEADHPRRDPAYSNSILNLRYNGNRGFHSELPRNPEAFWGFTGNDPRGADTDPRFDVMRGHITARAANLEARMLDSDDNFEAERPWTGQSFSYDMKELHRRLKNSTRVFTVSKVGRPWGRNIALDEMAGLRARRIQYWNGQESLDYPSRARFFGSDYQPAGDAEGGAVRGVDRRGGYDRAPWRRTTPDGDLAVQQYGQVRSQGRAGVGPQSVGGGRKRAAWSDQDIAEQLATARARGANRQTLGASMAVAARHRKHARATRPDDDPGYSHETLEIGKAAVQQDVARAYRQQAEDTDRRPAGSVQDDEGGVVAGAGLRPAANPERALRAGQPSQPDAVAHLANAETIVRGLKEGSASARRKIANHIIAAGVMSDHFEGLTPAQGRGMMPAADLSRMQKFSETALTRAAAAEGLEVASYKTAPPIADERRVARGRATDQTLFAASNEQGMGGKTAVTDYRGHTGEPVVLGDAADDVFGFDAEVQGGMTGGAPSARALRNMHHDDEGMVEDGASLAEIES